jgi:hypothetical protein
MGITLVMTAEPDTAQDFSPGFSYGAADRLAHEVSIRYSFFDNRMRRQRFDSVAFHVISVSVTS